MPIPQWLDWAQRLQAIAQDGLTFCRDPFDIERYHQIQRIAAEMLSSAGQGQPDDAHLQHTLDWITAETGYATPKLDVRGVVFRGEGILLVRERRDGRWTLPGGWVDVGDSPREAVEREIREESGYEARAVRLLAVYDRNRHPHPPHPQHIYKLFILCDLVGGAPAVSEETDGVGFFTPDALPELSLGRVTPGQIARMFAFRAHPEWPPDLD
ncbi:MAG: NUDIX hydrolase [Chloroflexi bacterium]|nr:NUDIX hydrolase [Chloroflexota bacterium]